MGATVIAVGEGEVDWVIMEDPEGNGSSVLSPRHRVWDRLGQAHVFRQAKWPAGVAGA
jgi:hypothetical protein